MNALASAVEFSAYQRAVLADIATGSEHTMVYARAGAGKTFTLIEALRHVPAGKTVLLACFGADIEKTLAARAPRGVDVKNFHKLGFAAIRNAYGTGYNTIDLDKFKTHTLIEALFGKREETATLAKLVDLAKSTLACLGVVQSLADLEGAMAGTAADQAKFRRGPLTALDELDLRALDDLIDVYDIALPEAPAGTESRVRATLVRMAAQVLVRSAEMVKIIDFSDMCWLPIVHDLALVKYDRVFIDETQDVSEGQLQLVLKSLKPNARICAVGDDRQGIFAFRGAGENVMARLAATLRARSLPLSITYRCARAIVTLARTEVSDLEAAPGAPLGAVTSATVESLLTEAEPGDMIVSRLNAPLVGLCLGLLARGVRAAIAGRNIGEGLVRLIDKARAKTLPDLRNWISAWTAREVERLVKKKLDPQEAQDREACILVIVAASSSVAEVRASADRLFSDKNNEPKVLLGSTHKMKGLEADRVWMLVDTYKRERGGQEANLWYVAVTRAKTELVLVNTPKQERAS